jgi:hypothetical protein
MRVLQVKTSPGPKHLFLKYSKEVLDPWNGPPSTVLEASRKSMIKCFNLNTNPDVCIYLNDLRHKERPDTANWEIKSVLKAEHFSLESLIASTEIFLLKFLYFQTKKLFLIRL